MVDSPTMIAEVGELLAHQDGFPIDYESSSPVQRFGQVNVDSDA
jgi:hypothetical protein